LETALMSGKTAAALTTQWLQDHIIFIDKWCFDNVLLPNRRH